MKKDTYRFKTDFTIFFSSKMLAMMGQELYDKYNFSGLSDFGQDAFDKINATYKELTGEEMKFTVNCPA